MNNNSDFVFNLKQDLPDWRDLVYVRSDVPLRDAVDLRKYASPVEDQGQLGSCTSNALVGAYEMITLMDQPARFVDLSRLFIYYNTRKAEGLIQEDSGSTLRDALKAVKRDGACTDVLWPYVIENFTVEPPAEAYRDAESRNIKDYFRLTTHEDILDVLNNNKPVIIGMLVYESFMNLSPTNTILRGPFQPRWQASGGHAVLIVGYVLSLRQFLVRNSFGPNWGMGVYCWIPFEYIRTEAMSAWVCNIDLK